MIKFFRRRFSPSSLRAPTIHPLSQAIPRGVRVVFAVAKNFDTFLAGEVRRGIVSRQEGGRERGGGERERIGRLKRVEISRKGVENEGRDGAPVPIRAILRARSHRT